MERYRKSTCYMLAAFYLANTVSDMAEKSAVDESTDDLGEGVIWAIEEMLATLSKSMPDNYGRIRSMIREIRADTLSARGILLKEIASTLGIDMTDVKKAQAASPELVKRMVVFADDFGIVEEAGLRQPRH